MSLAYKVGGVKRHKVHSGRPEAYAEKTKPPFLMRQPSKGIIDEDTSIYNINVRAFAKLSRCRAAGDT